MCTYFLCMLLAPLIYGFQGSYRGLDTNYNPVTETFNCSSMYDCINSICNTKHNEYIHLIMYGFLSNKERKVECSANSIVCWGNASSDTKEYRELQICRLRENCDDSISYTLRLINKTKEAVIPDHDNFWIIVIGGFCVSSFMISMYIRRRPNNI